MTKLTFTVEDSLVTGSFIGQDKFARNDATDLPNPIEEYSAAIRISERDDIPAALATLWRAAWRSYVLLETNDNPEGPLYAKRRTFEHPVLIELDAPTIACASGCGLILTAEAWKRYNHDAAECEERQELLRRLTGHE